MQLVGPVVLRGRPRARVGIRKISWFVTEQAACKRRRIFNQPSAARKAGLNASDTTHANIGLEAISPITLL